MYCVVKINDWWLANWEGDPGRTLKLENAKKFPTRATARRYLDLQIKKYGMIRNFSDAMIIVKES